MQRPIPTAIMAFTNDPHDWLGELNTEFNQLIEIMEKRHGYFHLRPHYNLRKDDFLDLINVKGNNIAIFHYGGHAKYGDIHATNRFNGIDTIEPKNIKNALSGKENLVVLFLNACKTNQTITASDDRHAALTIVTTIDINDKQAGLAAMLFYKALMENATLGEAFDILNKKYNRYNPTDIIAFEAIWKNEAAKSTRFFDFPIFEGLPHDGLPQRPKYLNTIRFINPKKVFGRDNDIEKIHQHLTKEHITLLINAIGGVGKTTTALYYAKQYEKDYQHIIWIDGDSTLNELLLNDEALLENLGISQRIKDLRELKDLDTAWAVMQQTLKAIQTPVLWIADNINPKTRGEILYLKESLPKHYFLFTSRDKAIDIPQYNLNYLDEANAIALFLNIAHSAANVPEHKTILAELLAKVKFHSYVTVLLAKTFQRKLSIDLVTFAKQYGTAFLNIHERAKIQLHEGNEATFMHKVLLNLFNTTDIATFPDELFLLQVFSVLPQQPHPIDIIGQLLITPDWDTDRIDNALGSLVEWGWVEQANPEERLYECHLLIQETIRHQHPLSAEQFSPILDNIRAILKKHIDNEFWQNRVWLPYSIAFAQHYSHDDKLRATIYTHIGIVYHQQGNYTKALRFHEKALDIREQVFGTKHSTTANTYGNIGNVYYTEGKYPKAFDFYKKALEIQEQARRILSLNIVTNYNNIDIIYNEQGNDNEAFNFYEKALTTQEREWGILSLIIATTYNNIGNIYNTEGNNSDALCFYQNALRIRKQIWGRTHADIADSYNNIGGVYAKQDKYRKAFRFHKKALAIQEQVLGKDHTNTASSYNNIGVVYAEQRNYNKALHFFEKALMIREQAFGKEHPNTADAYTNMGNIYYELGNYSEALYFYEKALAIQEQILGKEHPNTANTYNNIGEGYDKQRNYPQALPLYQQAIHIFKNTLPFGHQTIQKVLNNYLGCLITHENEMPPELYKQHNAFIVEHFKEYFEETD